MGNSLNRNKYKCKCGQCENLADTRPRLCCQNVEKFAQFVKEFPDQTCLIQHPGFSANCLNTYVLNTAYRGYRVTNGELPGSTEEIYETMAYMNLCGWLWGRTDENERPLLPSCVWKRINSTFEEMKIAKERRKAQQLQQNVIDEDTDIVEGSAAVQADFDAAAYVMCMHSYMLID